MRNVGGALCAARPGGGGGSSSAASYLAAALRMPLAQLSIATLPPAKLGVRAPRAVAEPVVRELS